MLALAGERAAEVKPVVGVGKEEPAATAPRSGAPDAAAKTKLVEAYGKLPMRFEANQGQTDHQVKFLSRGRGYGLFLTPDEAVLSLQSASRKSKVEGRKVNGLMPDRAAARAADAEAPTPAILRMKLLGAKADPLVQGLDELPGKSNYLIGNDRKRWRTGVPNYARVRYTEVYPGVDLVYYGNQGQLEYDWTIAPGADPNAIRFALQGTESARIDENGDLVLRIEGGEVRFHKPAVYQEKSAVGSRLSAEAKDEGQRTKDGREYVDGKYILRTASNSQITNHQYEVSFELASYDRSLPLIIDPVLSYATYLGGSSADYGLALRVLDDGAGGAYAFVAGRTTSADFPPNPPTGYDPTCGTDGACNPTLVVLADILQPVADGFIAKLSADGTSLVYSTYLGGSAADEVDALAVDSSGNAYLTGFTFSSTDFPVTAGAYTTVAGTLFVAKLLPDGSDLVYSARFGGTSLEQATSIAIDPSGNAYVGGYTYSTDFPTTVGSFLETSPAGTCGISSTFACPHGYLARLSADGSTLDYATYLGGSQADYIFGIALDGSGNVYSAGVTQSSDFPTTAGAYQGTFGGETASCDAASTFCGDAFVTKLDGTLAGPAIFSTYLGGSGNDVPGIGSIALDGSGNVYVGGQTNSSNLPTTAGAYQANLAGSDDAFVAEIDSTGASLLASTFLGGTDVDIAQNLARDTNGSIYVSGYTLSTDFPTASPIQGSCASCGNALADAFVAKFNSSLTGLIFGDYLGGTGTEDAFAIAVDPSGQAYVAGTTDSTDFPATAGAFQGTSGGGIDAYVAKFTGLALPVAQLSAATLDCGSQNITSFPSPTACPPGVTLTNLGDAPLTFTGFPVTESTNFPGTSGDFTWNDSIATPCGTSLAAGASCTRTVFFEPTAAGNRGAGLSFVDNSRGVASSTQSVTVTGVGTQPVILVSPTSPINFGQVLVGNNSALAPMTVTNNGDGPLTVAVGVAAPFSQALSGGGSCPIGTFVLSPGPTNGCNLYVAFQPDAIGLFTGTLAINSDDPTTPLVNISLSGSGVSAGVLTGLPGNFNFGSLLVGTTFPPELFTLTNTGTGPLGINNVELQGNYDFASGTTCPAHGSLAAGASCAIYLTFTPESPGSIPNQGQLKIEHDGAGSPAVMTLAGSGFVLATNTLVAFAPKVDYATGTTPFGGTAGDLNSDGKVDIVLANYGSNDVTVFLGKGDGTFQAGVSYPAGPKPTSVEAKDVTGDGIPDLIVTDQNAANPSAGAVQLLVGNGNGTFQAAVSLGTFNGPNSVVVGDLNHDGIRDLAIAEGGGGAGTTVAVLLGTGGGNFQSPVSYTVPINPATIARVDVNNDGNHDLAVLSNIGQLSILLGNGDGTFQNAVSYPTGSFPNGRMAITDFNGDGYDDIAVAQNGSNSVGVFLNDGSGGFPTRTDYTATGARAVTTADFNGDGKFDLAVADQSTGVVWILIGNGDGTFRVQGDNFPASGTPTDVGALDLNADGKPDLAVAGSLSVLINTSALVIPYNLTFGNQLLGTSSTTQRISLYNASPSVSLNVTGITFSGDFTDAFQNCTTTPITPGNSCFIDVEFTPTALGARVGTLSISTDAAASPHVVSLTGTGTGTPAMTLTTVNFPGNPVGYSLCPTKDVTVTNSGDIPLTFVGAAFSAGSPFTVTSDCPTTLAAGASLACLHVKFIPNAQGVTEDLLTVTTSPASTGNAVTVTGTGTPPCTLLVAVHTATLLRGADAQDFAIQDGKPSCSPVSLNLTCSVKNPAACALNPAMIAPSGSSTLRVSNLRAVTNDSVDVQVTSVSEFRTASERITVRFADFAFTQAPDSATIRAGETASYSLAIRPVNGLAGALSLSCSGAPRGARCMVEPSSVTLDGSNLAQVKVRVTTTGRAATPPATNLPLGFGSRGGRGVLMLMFGLLVMLAVAAASRLRRSPVLQRLALAAAMLALLLWASCGGGGMTTFNSGGTPAGTFSLTITGTYTAAQGSTPGTLTNTTNLTLKVN
ncbi:MAG: beta strand repeat-containing protein [Terriglobia bacterium]